MTNSMLRELAILSRMPEGNIVLGVIAYRRDQAMERLINATGEEVYRLQGSLRALDELLRDIKEAPQRLNSANGSGASSGRQLVTMRTP